MRSSDDIWKAGGGETAFSFKDGTRTILFNNQSKKVLNWLLLLN